MDDYQNTYEPMDVDMSANSTSAMDISYTEIEDSVPRMFNRTPTPISISLTKVEAENFNGLTPCQITLEQKCVKVKKNNSSINTIVIISVCLLSIILYNIFSYKCYKNIKFSSLSERLHTRLYGQTLAIENVVEFLDLEDNAKILVLYGGTGVGKTFMVSLLFQDFFNHTNVYYYSMTNLENALNMESMFGITLCETSIVIIDDIALDNDIRKYIKQLIARSSNLSKNINIILIYNCANFDKQFISNCPSEIESQLESTLFDIEAVKRFVKLEPLTESTLKKCIQYELGGDINETDMIRIMKNFNVKKDGCKGVHQKTKYLNVIH